MREWLRIHPSDFKQPPEELTALPVLLQRGNGFLDCSIIFSFPSPF